MAKGSAVAPFIYTIFRSDYSVQILGLSAFYHDSAAALVRDGKIVAAAQEERFTRKKHDSEFPINAVEYCLSAADTTADQIKHVAFYDKPFLKFERLLETYVAFAPREIPLFFHGNPRVVERKTFPEIAAQQETKADRPRI